MWLLHSGWHIYTYATLPVEGCYKALATLLHWLVSLDIRSAKNSTKTVDPNPGGFSVQTIANFDSNFTTLFCGIWISQVEGSFTKRLNLAPHGTGALQIETTEFDRAWHQITYPAVIKIDTLRTVFIKMQRGYNLDRMLAAVSPSVYFGHNI